MGRFLKLMCATVAMVFVVGVCGSGIRAEEDAAVTRARELARQQYEAEKATRLAEAAKKKLDEQMALQRAIAMTRQGAISIYNPGGAAQGFLPFSCRWLLWDGTYTDWIQSKVDDKKAIWFYKQGGIKFNVKFSSTVGGEKKYLLETSQLPNDVKPAFDDAKAHQFKWVDRNSLDLYTGKPKNW